ncbi:dUTP diphosphatase [Pseudogemmatithrix spongiicola]|uniref:dUTP diphosphatase n=1 Tax=Pseudogemmatithrix spongiicola TaxID=3062599 RepID=A0AA49Q521_9BACT|nr:dUTP diphosphatase [Gemmatimonadaceae bacterium 'strain 138']WKW15535.1 dUTP diphosphatase [Gemmatimonadaceae bacterium 'strain 318']
MEPIVFEALHPGVRPPQRATAASAGHDLAACLLGGRVTVFIAGQPEPRALEPGDPPTVVLAPGEKALIPLGFRARLPVGYEAQVRPRSGTSLKTDLVIVNSPGTIDADFPDEWMVPVKNGGTAPLRIAHGERIAQMVLAKYEILDFAAGTVARSTERAGGFGSTGR